MIPHVGLLLWTGDDGGFAPAAVAVTPFYGYFPPSVRVSKDNRVRVEKDNRVSVQKDNRTGVS